MLLSEGSAELPPRLGLVLVFVVIMTVMKYGLSDFYTMAAQYLNTS